MNYFLHHLPTLTDTPPQSLRSFYHVFPTEKNIVSEILQSCFKLREAPKEALWLIHYDLHHSEIPWKRSFIYDFLGLFPFLNHFESHLNWLKCIPLLSLTPSNARLVEPFIRLSTSHSHTGIKTSAYYAWLHLSSSPIYREELRAHCAGAFPKEIASVKVPIKRILQQLELN